jgi:hypothetical protein
MISVHSCFTGPVLRQCNRCGRTGPPVGRAPTHHPCKVWLILWNEMIDRYNQLEAFGCSPTHATGQQHAREKGTGRNPHWLKYIASPSSPLASSPWLLVLLSGSPVFHACGALPSRFVAVLMKLMEEDIMIYWFSRNLSWICSS